LTSVFEISTVITSNQLSADILKAMTENTGT